MWPFTCINSFSFSELSLPADQSCMIKGSILDHYLMGPVVRAGQLQMIGMETTGYTCRLFKFSKAAMIFRFSYQFYTYDSLLWFCKW